MEATDAPLLTPLADADAAAALRLSDEAGWNQTVGDWRMMICAGRAICARDADGRPVASALALPYPPDFGWISMVLVTASRRRRGLAGALMARCVAQLEAQGLAPMLDATPAGRRVYAPLGFRPIEGIARWRGRTRRTTAPDGVRPAEPDDLERIVVADARAFGAERRAILADLLWRERPAGFVSADGAGFVLWRRGRTARQIGPLAVPDERTAERLLSAALGAAEGPALLDVPDRERRLGARLAERGFAVERPFTRMGLRRTAPWGRFDEMRVFAGPELG